MPSQNWKTTRPSTRPDSTSSMDWLTSSSLWSTAMTRVRDRIEPDPDWTAAYEHGYDRYKLLYPTLKPLEA